ncbi:MAG: hypothetical protein MZU79_02175 [Anaerotruncus sp.]|nr:hypothetical protein [Anaerotruncus sp.]
MAQLDDEVLQNRLVEIKTQFDFASNVYDKQKIMGAKDRKQIQYLTAKNNKEAMENRYKALEEQMDMCKIRITNQRDC